MLQDRDYKTLGVVCMLGFAGSELWGVARTNEREREREREKERERESDGESETLRDRVRTCLSGRIDGWMYGSMDAWMY